ncbi:MAG: alanine--tRNA ligase [Dehalococcoidales bacterium]|nr:alanine--tRNA ligase [Dehalococcoidales bacterium]
MNSDELRSSFLKFYEDKGHKVVSSSSLVPKDDPTLLLTSAGMVQMKPYFLGEATPPSKRLTSCQKCFRTTDIESVGDNSHCTFFEMLGNFSVGDYFKKDTITWAYEYVTKILKIPPERLWVTIYLDDDEAFGHWRALGMPEKKIHRFGEEENFWGPVGNSGPCGPDNEIFYDLGEEKGCGKPDCKPNDGCGRFLEISTLVFMQYNQDASGKRTPLPSPSVDTGMGLDRTLTVISGKQNVYETDLFADLLNKVAELSGKKYGVNPDDTTAIRIVAEHGRALAFLIADGVLPDNEGRGYVLRRLLRRAALFGRRLGLDKPFLAEIVKVTIKNLNHVYPELKARQDFIVKLVTQEETRFEETLSTGLEIIENLLSAKSGKSKQISGADAFKLSDTYGFPIELTKEIVSRSGFSVDMDGFEQEMDKQRQRARTSHKFTPGAQTAGAAKLDVKATAFVGYTCLDEKAKILKILVDGKEVNEVKAGQSAAIALDTTPFYGEMGGQVGDTGEIVGKSGKFTVTGAVHPTPEVTLHNGKLAEGKLSVGDAVQAVVNMERRRDIQRNHTATHLLQAALREVLGGHIQQRGSLVAPEHLRFDFSHLAAMTPDEVKKVQQIVNDKIRQNLLVADEQTDYKKAIASGATALFDEKYGDVVRVLRIGDPVVSMELCGGTHAASTGEIGYFHILSESSIGAGIRRIEAVTGRGAEALVDKRLSTLDEISQSVEASPENVKEKFTAILNELEDARKRALALEKEVAKNQAASLLEKAETVKGVKLITARLASESQTVLRETADFLRDKLGSGIVVLGAVSAGRPVFIATVTQDLVDKGYNAGDIVKKVSTVAGGGGGGKANFAQAGGKDINKLDEALNLVKSLI